MHSRDIVFILIGIMTAQYPAMSWADDASIIKVLSIEGRVLVNGKNFSALTTLPVGAKIETSAGSITIAIGTDNVMKINSESSLFLKLIAGGKIETVLEKGRVEGVRHIDAIRNNAATVVGTSAGAFEISGGRYVVEVKKSGDGAQPEAKFVALDGNAKISSNGLASLPSQNMNAGEVLVVRTQGSKETRGPASPSLVSAQPAQSTRAVSYVFVPRTPTEYETGAIVRQTERLNRGAEPPVTNNNPLKRDPLQPVNKNPTLTGKFVY